MTDMLTKIKEKKLRTAVIGLGYVGLPLACEMAKAGFETVGIDLDKRKVSSINEGRSYIQDVPEAELAGLVKSGKIKAASDYSVLKDVDAVSVCVPTPLRKSKEPDISYIVSSCTEIAKYLHKGQLIILESTTYPGTTDEIVLPILLNCFEPEDYPFNIQKIKEKVAQSELKVGEDFFLAFSPERVDPSNPKYKTKDIPKVIGGMTSACTEVSAAFYRTVFPQVVPVSSTQAAEMVKLLENTFRSVNIALVNEMSLMSEGMGVDIWEVIEAAATKPFGFMPFYPGPGLGGHCIPIDPLYLTWKARLFGFEPKFIELAAEVNQKMPAKVVEKVQDRLNETGKSLKGAKVIIIGVAYKKNVDDVRESPALEIIHLLQKKGARVDYHDPYVSCLKIDGLEKKSVGLDDGTVKKYDCAVITTDHDNIDFDMVKDNAEIIVDTRNAIKTKNNF